MALKRYIPLIVACLVFQACRYSHQKKSGSLINKDSITASNSFTEMFFDSSALQKFISNQTIKDSLAIRMRDFYAGRNYQFAWFFKEGIADYAGSFLQIVDDYIGYSGDSAMYNTALHRMVDSASNRNQKLDERDQLAVETEFQLTKHFFIYSRRAYQGRNNLNAKELEWFIPRKKIDLVAFLDSSIKSRGKNFSSLEPVNRQYGLLKSFLLKYYQIEKAGGWMLSNPDKRTYNKGDSARLISQVKNRLSLVGDYSAGDTSPLFTAELSEAVKQFQRRYGFQENGVISSALLTEMKRPIRNRIEQILINMERMRWSPAQPSTDYLLVNIPEFRLHVYEKGKYNWSMNIVTGSATHNTVIFTGTLKHIVFSPYWNVPPGILKNEILPAISRNKNYLAAHNMEWYGNTVRQKPGPNNSLGFVKFLFPNDYNIYLHDTPSKSLFNEHKRAFSHGCIRLSQPLKLAMFLLRNNSNWDSARILKAMRSGKEQFVTVKETVPVYIGYFTAWVDGQGKLNFRDDIYGHDRKMAAHLFADNK